MWVEPVVTITIPLWMFWVFAAMCAVSVIQTGVSIYHRRKLLKVLEGRTAIIEGRP